MFDNLRSQRIEAGRSYVTQEGSMPARLDKMGWGEFDFGKSGMEEKCDGKVTFFQKLTKVKLPFDVLLLRMQHFHMINSVLILN